MIFKELDPFTPSDKFRNAGRAAEEKAAFYLKRFLEDEDRILILNGIRLEANDDAAQVDHLVIHEYGIIIIESKSISGKMQLKDDGQWLRWYDDKSEGMESPIVQARAQEKFFKKVLNQSTKQPKFFDTVPFDILVAVSDKGQFIPPKNGNRPKEVCKADQLPDIIHQIISNQKSIVPKPRFIEDHMKMLATFLCNAHKPLVNKTTEAPATVLKAEEPKAVYKAKNSCANCGKEVDKKVVTYCLRFHKKEFSGKVYCQDCQKTFSKN